MLPLRMRGVSRMTVRFTLQIPVNASWGMNAVYSGKKHWNQRQNQANDVHLLVKAAIRKQNRNVRLLKRPVAVRILYNSRLDIDNHGYLTKLIIDGMKGVLIEDDDRRYVKSVTQAFHAGAKDLILVEVEETNEETK